MNDTDKAPFQRALDLVEWLDVRIAQRLEQQLEQRLVQEREYWRCQVVDLMVAERERLVALVEEEHRKVIDWAKADHKEVVDLAKWNHEQSKRLIAEVTKSFDQVFDRIEAKLDQFATLDMQRPDQSSPPRNN